MQEFTNRPARPRPAFHFYPLGESRMPVRFRVFAILPNGSEVLLAQTATHADALATTRLIPPGHGITVDIRRA
jgi:hypothetical protein